MPRGKLIKLIIVLLPELAFAYFMFASYYHDSLFVTLFKIGIGAVAAFVFTVVAITDWLKYHRTKKRSELKPTIISLSVAVISFGVSTLDRAPYILK